MVRTFLVRGMLVGIVAGLLSFAFLKIYGEPQVDRAVAFETLKDEAKTAAQKAESHDHTSASHDHTGWQLAVGGTGYFALIGVGFMMIEIALCSE
jgi:hypothetical protein